MLRDLRLQKPVVVRTEEGAINSENEAALGCMLCEEGPGSISGRGPAPLISVAGASPTPSLRIADRPGRSDQVDPWAGLSAGGRGSQPDY